MTPAEAPGPAVVVGSGRVGWSLASAIHEVDLFSGVTLVGRRPRPPVETPSALTYASTGGEPLPARLGPEGHGGISLLVFCVADDLLVDLSTTWARALRAADLPVGVALHTSGLHPATALAGLASDGTAVGSWHPLLALARPRRDAFRGVTIGVEGDDEAVELGAEIARRIGASPIRVDPGRKASYHAAAVFASNYLVACLAVAARELRESCLEEAGLDELLPLARSAVDNLESAGLEAGATGPVARGDVGTVATHLEALDPTTRSLYRALARELIAAVGGRLDLASRERLLELLEANASVEPAP